MINNYNITTLLLTKSIRKNSINRRVRITAQANIPRFSTLKCDGSILQTGVKKNFKKLFNTIDTLNRRISTGPLKQLLDFCNTPKPRTCFPAGLKYKRVLLLWQVGIGGNLHIDQLSI